MDRTDTNVEVDYAIVLKFHEEAYEGKRIHTAGEITNAHAAWWRIARHYKDRQEAPPLETLLLLLYSKKYLPATYGADDE